MDEITVYVIEMPKYVGFPHGAVVGTQVYWAGSAHSTKSPRIYMSYDDANKTLRNRNNYIPKGSKIMLANLRMQGIQQGDEK